MKIIMPRQKYDENYCLCYVFFFGCPAMVVSSYDLVKVSSHGMSSLVCKVMLAVYCYLKNWIWKVMK